MINVRSRFMESHLEESLSSMKEISRIFYEFSIDHCFIGGAILPFYDYRRMTEDVDLLVSSKDKYKLHGIPIGYMRDITKASTDVRRMQLHNPPTLVEIIYSGEDLNKTGFIYPEPDDVSTIAEEVPILTLEYLVLFKVRSGMESRGRLRDLGDVQELIRHNDLPFNFLNKYSKSIVDKYQEIWYDLLHE